MKFAGICSRCLERIETEEDSITTGYGLDKDNNKVCYHCCALEDQDYMREHGQIDLYLSFRDRKAIVSNWPSSLEFTAISWSKSKTNWGDDRYDVWFRFDGNVWWGRHVGDSHQLIKCRRTKRTRL